ncbi:MAG: D-alanyl-D-alanine carboxypeptidase/D-alanyl-D-alanine-endopeptidase [Candidatus Dactylopiibacterium carminicum]|uniref:D-alanyl-D-alanine carboxypeptidase/D-alanyl-D-alanine-endopeptidase n=2 Tax=Candidatus Dactylopiibacterium carminicum TaxID=857335 RepID=A0A272EZ00_9RHOO|nr:D-alanyl-D-alanine carboxypeptidase/D-alanyl-D-alanine-endopeptidase [Candidatus Dactylopiibacterium carminicum]PAS95354.1 MAG: D-alanyl-D-alanine carboxypeptidase/D-alanyl-D-alanine-endopeptidase [Candidatus Dactylopiibacterium carminicum]
MKKPRIGERKTGILPRLCNAAQNLCGRHAYNAPMKILRPMLLALLAGVSGAGHAALPESLARPAREAGLPPGSIALWVAPAGSSQATLQHNASLPMNPASVMKLLTTQAALEHLGSSYNWQTTAYLRGALREDGILLGDLGIRAGGDPFLTWDRLGQWLRDWRTRGLREIRGDIVLDERLFAPQPATPLPFDDSPHRAYNADPAPFLVNFGALSLRLEPGIPGQGVRATALQPATPLRLINRLQSMAGACPDWRNALRADIAPEGTGLRVTLDGRMPGSCGERIFNLRAGDNLAWAETAIRTQWSELGGRWRGRLVRGEQSPDAAAFSTWASPPLSDVLRDMDKWSNNVVARQVFLSLGAPDGVAWSVEHSRAWLRAWMPSQGLDPAQWVVDNGSGLSRDERTTAQQLGALLRAAWLGPRMPEFLAAQPVLGRDGTLRRRLVDSPLAGRAYIKTGTLDGVRSAAGFLLDIQGRWQTFVFLVNHPRAAQAEALLDTLLRELYLASAVPTRD